MYYKYKKVKIDLNILMYKITRQICKRNNIEIIPAITKENDFPKKKKNYFCIRILNERFEIRRFSKINLN